MPILSPVTTEMVAQAVMTQMTMTCLFVVSSSSKSIKMESQWVNAGMFAVAQISVFLTVIHPAEALGTGDDLNRTDTKTCAHSGHCCDNRKAVNNITHPTPTIGSEQFVQRRTDGHGEIEPVCRESSGDSNHEVGRPRVRVMHIQSLHLLQRDNNLHGDHDGPLVDFVLRLAGFRVPIVMTVFKWLGDAVEEETYCHASREEHGEVGKIVELGFLVFFAQLDVSIAESKPEHEEGKGWVAGNLYETREWTPEVSHAVEIVAFDDVLFLLTTYVEPNKFLTHSLSPVDQHIIGSTRRRGTPNRQSPQKAESKDAGEPVEVDFLSARHADGGRAHGVAIEKLMLALRLAHDDIVTCSRVFVLGLDFRSHHGLDLNLVFIHVVNLLSVKREQHAKSEWGVIRMSRRTVLGQSFGYSMVAGSLNGYPTEVQSMSDKE